MPPKNGDPEGKNTEASGSRRVSQSPKEAQSGRPAPKRSRSPQKVSGAGSCSEAGRSTKNAPLSTFNPFSCWARSQIQVKDDTPTTIAAKIAATAERGELPQQPNDFDCSKIPTEKDKTTNRSNPSGPSDNSARQSAGEKGSGVSVTVVVGKESSSRRAADPPLSDGGPPPYPGLDHKPRIRRTSSAHDRGFVSSEPAITPRSASFTREKIVIVPLMTNEPSAPRPKAAPPTPGPVQYTSGASTSKLAIACACNKEKGVTKAQPGSQKSKVEARMSRGSESRTGHGKRDYYDDEEARLDNLIGLRAPRRANAEAASSSRGGRSRSPIPEPMKWRDDNDYEVMKQLVADIPKPAKRPRGNVPVDDIDYEAISQVIADRSKSVTRSRGNVPVVQPVNVAVKRRPLAVDSRWGSTKKRTKLQRGLLKQEALHPRDVRWNARESEGKRGKAVQALQAATTPNPWTQKPERPEIPWRIDQFRPRQGDIILRHRKCPSEPMIEIFCVNEAGQSVLRERDQVIRQIIEYDERADNLVVHARLWRTALVEVADADGNNYHDLRITNVGYAEITFDHFRVRRATDGYSKRFFGRRFEAKRS